MSLVTIAVALYNNENYVERCIKSILNQTETNYEVLIIDDGSTDNSQDVCRKYVSDKRIRYIKKTNGGLSSSRQMALEEANGDYICFIDADDYLMPTYLEKMRNKLDTDNSDICVCSTSFYDEKGAFLSNESNIFSCIESDIPFLLTPESFSGNEPLINNLHLSDSWNKLFRLKSLRNYGVIFCMKKGLNGTDTLFNRMVALHSPKYSSVSDNLYNHVIYNSSAVHRKNKNLLESYQLITRKCVMESKRIGIYNVVKDYLINTYQNNLSEVLLDEFNDNEGYINRTKIFLSIRKKNIEFVNDVDKSLNDITSGCPYLTRIILLLFNHFIFLLSPYFLLGSRMKHLKRRCKF